MNKRMIKKLNKKNATGFKYELGNMMFGNSRGEFEIPRGWSRKFFKLTDACGCDSRGNYDFNDEFNSPYWGFENDTFRIEPYYWGDDEEIAERPNFLYKPENIKIDWYKHPFRDTWSNIQMNYYKFAEIINKCIKSLVFDRTLKKLDYESVSGVLSGGKEIEYKANVMLRLNAIHTNSIYGTCGVPSEALTGVSASLHGSLAELEKNDGSGMKAIIGKVMKSRHDEKCQKLKLSSLYGESKSLGIYSPTSVQELKETANEIFEKYKTINKVAFYGHPDRFMKDDDIQFIIKQNESIEGIKLDYAFAKLRSDDRIEIVMTKKVSREEKIKAIALPSNSEQSYFKHYPYSMKIRDESARLVASLPEDMLSGLKSKIAEEIADNLKPPKLPTITATERYNGGYTEYNNIDKDFRFPSLLLNSREKDDDK